MGSTYWFLIFCNHSYYFHDIKSAAFFTDSKLNVRFRTMYVGRYDGRNASIRKILTIYKEKGLRL